MVNRYGIMRIRPGMPGYNSLYGHQFPWIVFQGSQRVRGRAFSTWDKAMKYVARQFEGNDGSR